MQYAERGLAHPLSVQFDLDAVDAAADELYLREPGDAAAGGPRTGPGRSVWSSAHKRIFRSFATAVSLGIGSAQRRPATGERR